MLKIFAVSNKPIFLKVMRNGGGGRKNRLGRIEDYLIEAPPIQIPVSDKVIGRDT
jgi:hypothetical protein